MTEKIKNLKGSLEGTASVVATITTAVDVIHVVFPLTTEPEFFIKTALEAGGIKYPLEKIKLHAEKIIRSGGIGKGGYRIKAGASVEPPGGEIEFEKLPNSEVMMMADAEYVREGST